MSCVNLFDRPRNRNHATGSRDCTDRLATQRDDLRSVSQRQRTGDVGRCDLALRMAEDSVGLDSQRSPLRGQRHHHRKQHGLHHIDPVEARRTDAAPHGVEQRPVDKLGESRITAPHLIGERRCGVQQFDRHARPLRSLAGEDEDRPSGGTGLSSYHIRCRRAGGDRRQPSRQLVALGSDHHGAMVERRPGGGQ